MIERIERLRWRAMEHIYTIVHDLPTILQALASPIENVQKDARDRLFGLIRYYYDTNEVDFFVVPFLMELVSQQTWQDRNTVIRTLEEFVWGDSSDDSFPWTQETVVQWLTREYHRRFNPLQSLKKRSDNEKNLCIVDSIRALLIFSSHHHTP